ncbi:MAG TPA: site-specific integrase [Burkholderiales bacterium]|nr:site-specific integrase [Burkholderiales bacterium]
MSLAQARDAWGEAKKIRDDPKRGDPRIEREALAAQAQVERARGYTVREMLEDYFRLHAAKLASGAEQERMLRHQVLAQWGRRSAADVSARDVVDLAEKIAKRAPRVAGMTVSALRQAFRLAIERRRLDGLNPCSGDRTGQQSKARDRALDERELKALLEWLPGAKLSANVRDALRLQLLTGTRSGEVVGAEWREIDLEAAVWTQPATKTKNGRRHRVMLPPQAVELLAARRGLHERWVFPSREDRPLLQKAVGFAQYVVRESCPVKGWTVHDLRRTALTGLARLGCPRVVQDRIANHADRSIAAIYDRHTYDEEAREWLGKWAVYLDALSSDTNVVLLRRSA